MKNVDDGGPCCMDHFLMARRLVEAGVRVRDAQLRPLGLPRQQLRQCRERLPKLDMAPVRPDRGPPRSAACDKDVSVVVWGEFGRTPQINQRRRPRPLAAASPAPCWPAAACGPARSSARPIACGEVPKDRPVTFQEVFATLYHNLGIDPARPPQPFRPADVLLDEHRADPRAI